MSMSTIPHDQSSASTLGPGSKSVGAWLWMLLAAALLATALFGAWRATRPQQLVAQHQGPVQTSQGVTIASTATVMDRDAEPFDGNPLPRYPQHLLEAGIEGDVIARLQIDSSGRVNDAVVVSRQGQQDARLDQAAVDALLQWRFQPALRDGQAVASVVQVPVEFRTGR